MPTDRADCVKTCTPYRMKEHTNTEKRLPCRGVEADYRISGETQIKTQQNYQRLYRREEQQAK